MGYHVLHPDELEWEERPATEFTDTRHVVDLTTAGGIEQSRARLWKLPPRTRGRRHVEGAQEEVFVVLSGTLTMLLGDPPERVQVQSGGVVVVPPGTGIQQRNEGDEECVVFAYGAPPVTGQAEYLEDVPL
jgi:mannose-6-phosphate isomerase-like protein (cupin superfamily)